MNAEKLKLLIAEGEGLTVEFKEKCTPKIDKDIVAFANSKGGRILLGVSDDGDIVGEKLTNKTKAEINSFARNCEPPITISKISQIGDVVAIEIPSGDEKQYSCGSGYYRRLDAVTQKMTRREIQFLLQGIVTTPFEEKVNPDASWDNISKEKIRSFFKEAKIVYDEIDPQKVLGSLNLSKGHEIKPTFRTSRL